MNRSANHNQSGFTLPEVAIGIAIFIFIAASTVLSMMSLSLGNQSVSLKHEVNRELDTVRSLLRYKSADADWFANATDLVGTIRPEDESLRNPDVTVTSVIQNIVNGRREVTLTASWKDRGINRSKSQTFYISLIRARLDGAIVMVRVVNEDGDSVEGVTVEPFLDPGMGEPGVDGPLPEKITDSIGTVIFDGVRALSTGIKLKLDGRAIVHYFPHPIDPFQTSFSKEFQTTETLSGQTNEYFYNNCGGCNGPIVMRAPGHVEGYVEDFSDASPVEDGKVVFSIKDIELKKNEDNTIYILTQEQKEVLTDSAGYFKSPALVPGSYFISFVGNSEYAALAKPDDYHLLNGSTGESVSVAANGTVNILDDVADGGLGHKYRVVKKGSRSGRVYRITYNTVSEEFELGAAAPEDMVLKVYSVQRKIKHQDGATITDFDMTWTTPYRDYLFAAREFAKVLTNSSGDYSAPFFTPLITHREIATYSPDGTFNEVDVRPYNRHPPYGTTQVTIPDPMTPIQIIPIAGNFPRNRNQVKLLIVTSHGSNTNPNKNVRPIPQTGGAGPALTSDFTQNVYAEELGSGSDLYFLDRQALGSVSGTLQDGLGGPQWDPTFLEVRLMRTYWGSGGFGGLMLRHSSNLNTAYVHGWPHVTATGGLYSFTNNTTNPSNSGRILVPNVGTDQTTILFRGADIVNHNKNFFGTVQAWKRILDSNSIYRYVEVPDDDVDLEMQVKAYKYRNGGEWTSFAATDITVTNADYNESKPVRQLTYYSGQSNPVDILPGQDVPNVAVGVNTTSEAKWEQYHVEVLGSADDLWAPSIYPYEGQIAKGPVFSYVAGNDRYELNTSAGFLDPDTGLPVPLSIIRKVDTNITGMVTEGADGSGNPLAGVVVELIDHNLVGDEGNAEGILDTAFTLSDGAFGFPDHKILPTPFWNVQLRFTKPGYQSATSGRYSIYTPDDYSSWTIFVQIGMEKEPDFTGSGQAGN